MNANSYSSALSEEDKAIIEWCAEVCEATEVAPGAELREIIWHAAAITRAAAAIRALKEPCSATSERS